MKDQIDFVFLPAHPGIDATHVVKVNGLAIGELTQAPDGTYFFNDYSEGDDTYLDDDIRTLSGAKAETLQLLLKLGYAEEEGGDPHD